MSHEVGGISPRLWRPKCPLQVCAAATCGVARCGLEPNVPEVINDGTMGAHSWGSPAAATISATHWCWADEADEVAGAAREAVHHLGGGGVLEVDRAGCSR
jgi:hypothetical protein